MRLGARIEERVKSKGMTKSEFGRRINTSRQNIQTLLKKDSFDTKLLEKISKVLEHDFFQYLHRPFAPDWDRGKHIPTTFLLVEVPPEHYNKVKHFMPKQ